MKIKKIFPIGYLLLLSACSFNNDNGQFSLDLNQLNKQHTSQSSRGGIAGTYQTQSASGERFEQLQVKPMGNSFYQVTITTPNIKSGCQFKGKAQINNRQLRIPLSAYDKRLRSTMVITFTNNKAVVDTMHPEYFNDLKAFCHSGSLVGGYYKQ